jgi:hypothetical protein
MTATQEVPLISQIKYPVRATHTAPGPGIKFVEQFHGGAELFERNPAHITFVYLSTKRKSPEAR